MSKSLNHVQLIGDVGQDPEIKAMQSGDKVANLSIATSESWKDKTTGEIKENTQWHRVVVWNQGLIKVIEQYVKKGDKLYISGSLETRSWEQDGAKKYATEITLRNYNGELILLGGGRGADKTEAPVEQVDESDIPF